MRAAGAPLRTLAALALFAACGTLPAASTDGELPPLDTVLDGLARSTARYRENALGFSCREVIEWRTFPGSGRRREFAYVFVRDANAVLEDYRTRLEGRLDRRSRPLDPEAFGVPAFLRSALLWPLVFREERRHLHRYELLGQGMALGRRALRVRFEPVLPYVADLNEWEGTAWVDSETFQLLRVEALHVEYAPQQRRLERALAGEVELPRGLDIVNVSTEFGLVEHGLRLPSLAEVRRSRFFVVGRARNRRTREAPLFEVRQRYDDYRFFEVRTDERLSPAGPPEATPP